jgi:hypothetical protein
VNLLCAYDLYVLKIAAAHCVGSNSLQHAFTTLYGAIIYAFDMKYVSIVLYSHRARTGLIQEEISRQGLVKVW